MIHKFTSVKEVIARVYRDNDLGEGKHRVADMIQWAGEAMEKIGSFPILETKIAGKGDEPIVLLSNYQARLPANVHSIIQVAYSQNATGPFEPMYLNTGSFGQDPLFNSEQGNTDQFVTSDNNLIVVTMSLYDFTYEEAVAFINNRPNKKDLINGLVVSGRRTFQSEIDTGDFLAKYVISGEYIKTNIETGFIMIAYKSFPTDGEGYPMIPDLESFKEALYWYVTMKLMYPLWKIGKVRDAVYYDSRSSWNFHSKQAHGEAMMPNTPAERRALMNMWLRLIPEIEEDESFFKHLGDRQYTNFGSSRGGYLNYRR